MFLKDPVAIFKHVLPFYFLLCVLNHFVLHLTFQLEEIVILIHVIQCISRVESLFVGFHGRAQVMLVGRIIFIVRRVSRQHFRLIWLLILRILMQNCIKMVRKKFTPCRSKFNLLWSSWRLVHFAILNLFQQFFLEVLIIIRFDRSLLAFPTHWKGGAYSIILV